MAQALAASNLSFAGRMSAIQDVQGQLQPLLKLLYVCETAPMDSSSRFLSYLCRSLPKPRVVYAPMSSSHHGTLV